MTTTNKYIYIYFVRNNAERSKEARLSLAFIQVVSFNDFIPCRICTVMFLRKYDTPN